MADRRRFELVAELLVRRFPAARRVFDVAGGQGHLNAALVARGLSCVTFDTRHKHLPVEYAGRFLLPDEPCDADVLAGLHPDGATRELIHYAAAHRRPFIIVPCCSDNSMPYRPWMRHLDALATAAGFAVSEAQLPMEGRARALVGVPLTPSPAGGGAGPGESPPRS